MDLPLFESQPEEHAPLAHRMRPKQLEECVGQTHLLGEGKLLTRLSQGEELPSLIFWGPPGSGKTTLASLLATKKNYRFVALSAVTSGVKEIKEAVADAKAQRGQFGKRTVLFLDEIHRFNKSQQDSLLPHVENGTFVLFGATTENPSFEIVSALLSRARVVTLKPLEPSDLRTLLKRSLTDAERGLGAFKSTLTEAAEDFLAGSAHGDARFMLNNLETVITHFPKGSVIDVPGIEEILTRRSLHYDKSGEEHYNVISAFIKSMRDSDPDAALYYLARMLEAGEEPLFIARRMVIFASEDIGNANPDAVTVAVSCMQAFDFVGMPEGWIPLAQAASYLAGSPKSNASYAGYLEAKADVERHGALPVPLHLRNAPTKLMKNLGYHKGYQYAHANKDHIVHQQHLPDGLKDRKYYQPDGIGYEKKILEWLEKVRRS